MKNTTRGILMASCLVGVSALTLAVQATPSRASRVQAPAQQSGDVVSRFVQSLSPAQRADLLDASRGWDTQLNNERLLEQVEDDFYRVLTPAQEKQFDKLMGNNIAVGGTYRPTKCLLDSKIGLTFSIIGVIGCPGDTSSAAAYASYATAVYADQCFIAGSDTCPSAVSAALETTVYWSQLQGSCDLADTATTISAITYLSCGGTY